MQQAEDFGPFSVQQKELQNALDQLCESTFRKANEILSSQVLMDEQTTRRHRADLDRQIEAVHLAVANYFGDCDKQKQKIEAAISQSLDVKGFGAIGAELCGD
jgi:hypothetical protein